MRNILLITIVAFAICFPISSNSQNSGVIEYKKEMLIPKDIFSDLKNSNPQLYKNKISLLQRIAQVTEQIDYRLSFNGQESIYLADDILGKDMGLMRSLHSRIGKHYNNVKSNDRLQQIENQGKTFIVSREPIEWQITDSAKKVNGFKTLKAIASVKSYNHRTKKEQSREIEAWYSPEIPVSFDPEGYGGLPGLILELKIGSEHYYATSIKLSSSKLDIQKPTKGEKVSISEYRRIMANLGQQFKEFSDID